MLPSRMFIYKPAGGPEDLQHSCVIRWCNLLYTRTLGDNRNKPTVTVSCVPSAWIQLGAVFTSDFDPPVAVGAVLGPCSVPSKHYTLPISSWSCLHVTSRSFKREAVDLSETLLRSYPRPSGSYRSNSTRCATAYPIRGKYWYKFNLLFR